MSLESGDPKPPDGPYPKLRAREQAEVVGRLARGANVLVAGARGSGKTWLLRSCADELREMGYTVGLVGAGNGAASALEVLQLACLDLSTQIGDQRSAQRLRDGLAMPLIAQGPNVRLVELIRVLTGAVPPRTVMIVDEIGVDSAQTLFGRLRDELWGLGAAWLVSAPERSAGDILAPPADAFFDRMVRLPPLTTDQRLELIRALAPELPDAHGVAELADTPRSIIGLVRELELDPARAHDFAGEAARRAARLNRAASLGRSAAMLMTEIEQAPLSASDERIGTRFGWSRQRAAQVLSKLEQAGLVRSSMQPTERGAARKVYEVIR